APHGWRVNFSVASLRSVIVATRQSVGTRAKDSDRTDACQVLDHAPSEGQLSMEEHRQRVSAATNATTLGDLQSLVTDLQMSSSTSTRRRPDPELAANISARYYGARCRHVVAAKQRR